MESENKSNEIRKVFGLFERIFLNIYGKTTFICRMVTLYSTNLQERYFANKVLQPSEVLFWNVAHFLCNFQDKVFNLMCCWKI